MSTTRTATLGPAARPIAVPASFGDQRQVRASGRVVLPLHVRWSGSEIEYDLDDPADRLRVYEQVLREGTEADVDRFVDPDELVRVFDDLVLPADVRAAWSAWVDARRRG